jgi:hypothetical protein
MSIADVDTCTGTGEIKQSEDWLIIVHDMEVKMTSSLDWCNFAVGDLPDQAAASSESGGQQVGVSAEVSHTMVVVCH